ncbi:HSP20-like chaperone [Russula earlei]|uniref:HSP20-like chaperone n=1 Tax=Russula earlei TaxID=71964 RepID=A0ACC0U3N3_9AGAM|nr:HSP20-like chaperone [Russula earlei]
MSLTHYLNEYAFPLDRIVDDIFSNRRYRLGQQVDVFRPRLDIHHDDRANTVTATFELPGLQRGDVSIDIHNDILTVSGERRESSEIDEEGYALRERWYGKFSRTLTLPHGVKNEDIQANLANGVLRITFPKSAPETSPTKITIN